MNCFGVHCTRAFYLRCEYESIYMQIFVSIRNWFQEKKVFGICNDAFSERMQCFEMNSILCSGNSNYFTIIFIELSRD